MDKKEIISLITNLTEAWNGPASELTELRIDNLLDDGIIKDIPVISTFFSLFKSINNVRDFLFSRKLHRFLKNYHENKNEGDYLKVQERLKNIEKEALYFHLINIIDRNNEDIKIKILNNLFDSFILEEINYDYFIDLSLILNSIHPRAITMLIKISKSPTPFSFTIEDGRNSDISLLSMAGLLNISNVWGGTKLSINTFGQDFFKYGIKVS